MTQNDGVVGRSIDAITSAFSPNEKNVESMISFLLPQLKPQDLREAILKYEKFTTDQTLNDAERISLYNEIDPVATLFTHFKLNGYKGIRKIIKRRSKENGKRWWDYIALYLGSPEKLTVVMGADPRIKQLLQTREGMIYLKFLAERTYDFFYHWVWDFPRRHVDDDGKIIFKKTRIQGVAMSGFICKICNLFWSDEQMRKEYDNPHTTYLSTKESKKKK
ncbi:MAG: hypothetical protein ACYDAO_04355 [Thermoplasmataceae archaeon]